MLAHAYTLDYADDDYVLNESLGQVNLLDNSTGTFVKQIASFNCDKIGKNMNHVSVEYYFESPETNSIKSTKNRVPLISSVTFLNDAPNIMAIFTDLTFSTYKYKKYRNYKNGKNMFVSVFEKNKHIIYNGANCSLFINRDLSKVPIALFMNVFDSTSETCESLPEYKIIAKNDKYTKIEINNRFNFDFYESLLYQKNNDCVKFIWMILDEGTKNIEITDIFDIDAENTKMLKNKYGDVIQDIIEINASKFKLNRFFQRFQIKNVFPKNICKWFVDEAEKYVTVNGWETNNFNNYKTSDIKLSRLTTIHEYFLKYELEKVIELIEHSYSLPKETKFDITDLSIIKYSNELVSGLGKHTDSAFITFNISLNSQFEYEGGGTYFDDGLTFQNDIGDVLIHCGKIEHIGLPVKKGARYILVGFINIKYEA
uniref:Fe2OG dioxygenase domain-containing protein n=1 Tax=viral metagenome TaxID=1070528 RepID=A0A6C0B6C2_9ZZZZ